MAAESSEASESGADLLSPSTAMILARTSTFLGDARLGRSPTDRVAVTMEMHGIRDRAVLGGEVSAGMNVVQQYAYPGCYTCI